MTILYADISEAKDVLLSSSFVALKRASLLAREIAIQTGSHLVLVKDGKLLRIPANELSSPKNTL
jgi:hypothetical protein